jgi:hypothetical protein
MSRKQHLRGVLIALVCCALAGSTLYAQTSFGRISGSVTDPSGAAVPGATIKVTNTETQTVRTVETDGNGLYAVTNLPVGPYTLEASQKGFQSKQLTGINVVADGRLTADFKLAIGDVSQTVEVTAQTGETLNTTSGDLSRVIETRQVENLALNGGNYVELMTLVPGVVVTNPDQFSVTTSLSATNQNINGNRADSQNLTVDGAFNLVAGSNGSLMNNVNSNFIQEVKSRLRTPEPSMAALPAWRSISSPRMAPTSSTGRPSRPSATTIWTPATSSPCRRPSCATTISATPSAARSRRTSSSSSGDRNGSGSARMPARRA